MVPEPSVLLQPEDFPIPDADDMVIEISTDQMIDFDGSSTDVLEIFAVTGGDKKRVEANDGKRQETLSQSKGGGVAVLAGSQSFCRCCRQRSSDESSLGVDGEVQWKSQGTPLCPGLSRPRLGRSSLRQPHTFCTGRGLDLTVRGDKQWEAGVRRHQDGILVRRRGAP